MLELAVICFALVIYMKRKLFISINVPEKDRRRLVKALEKWQSLPIKWVREENLHITLAFLGFVDENMLNEICLKVSGASAESRIFDLEFSRWELFPSVSDPRMVALIGEPNENLRDLVNNIERELEISKTPKKSFRAHITLGRIRKRKWADLENKPAIDAEYLLSVSVESVDIMASDFDDEESEYVVIESCPLR